MSVTANDSDLSHLKVVYSGKGAQRKVASVELNGREVSVKSLRLSDAINVMPTVEITLYCTFHVEDLGDK